MATKKTGPAPKPEAPAVATVLMTRDPTGPEPHTADVHPDEVENYKRGDWKVAE